MDKQIEQLAVGFVSESAFSLTDMINKYIQMEWYVLHLSANYTDRGNYTRADGVVIFEREKKDEANHTN